MDLFLLHTLILAWASIGAARRVTPRLTERLLTAALLGWGNIVVSSLFLSALHQLGQSGSFFWTSILLAGLTCLGVRLIPPGESVEDFVDLPAPKFNPWLLGAFILTVGLLFCANLAAAYVYEPNNPDALAYQLPRALYYLGQGSLAHFDAADLRQVCLPFNYNLLQLLVFLDGAPLQCLNFFNVAAWALGGMAAYRVCRLLGVGNHASLIASWLVLMTPPVLAQAATTTPDLTAGVAVLCLFIFVLRWKQTLRTRYALLAALAVGLAAGSELGILLYVVAAGLPWLIWSYRTRPIPGWLKPRTWILPLLLASVLCLPFVGFNLGAKETGSLPAAGLFLHSSTTDPGFGFWSGFLPLLSKVSPLLTLNEDTVGFGIVGLLFLICGGYALSRPGNSSRGLAGLGLGWILIQLLLRHGSLSVPRDFVPAVFLLSPCMAAAIENARAGRSGARSIFFLLLPVVVLTTGWSAAVYLLKNTSRPLAPMLSQTFLPPALPSLPLVFDYHLARQSHINVDTDSSDERIFPFLALSRNQHFTSRHEIVPSSYNLLSRAGLSRRSSYQDLALRPAYTQLAISTKRTAGVEFIATVGSGAAARDYFGLVANAGTTAPVDSNRTVLVTLASAFPGQKDSAETQIRVQGLNPEDQTRLAVSVKYADGTTVPLTTLPASGTATVSITRPFGWLIFNARDWTTGAETGSSVLPYLSSPREGLTPIDNTLPSGPNSLFVQDVVLSRNLTAIAVEGLLPVEGPFPQWDLPFLRWAREPSVRLKISPTPHLVRLELSFSLRLHVRNSASVDLLFNGQVVKHYHLEDRTAWLDQTFVLTPLPGENIVEFRDVSTKDEPDWTDYLDHNPDVRDYLVTHHIPLISGAREHYETNGRAEGRTLRRIAKPEPAPDSYYFMFRKIRLEGFKSP